MPEPFLDSGAGLPDQGRVKAQTETETETETEAQPHHAVTPRQAGLDAGSGLVEPSPPDGRGSRGATGLARHEYRTGAR